MNKKISISLIVILTIVGIAYYFYPPTSNLLEGHGSILSPDRKYTIELSFKNPGLSISRTRHIEMPRGSNINFAKTTISPQNWTNHGGAFVFVDERNWIWAYDGAQDTFFYMPTEKGGASYTFESKKDQMPTEVESRLLKDYRIE